MTGTTSMKSKIKMGGAVIGGITDFTGPEGSTTIIDVSDLDSDAKEKILGLKDEGQFTFGLNYNPSNTSHIAVAAARASGALQEFEIDLGGTGKTLEFSAYVIGFAIEGGVEAALTGSVSLEISGAVTWPTA